MSPQSRTRRIAIAAATSLAILIGAAWNAHAESITVGKAVATAFPFTPIDVGIEVGIMKKYGFDSVQIASFGGDAKVQQALFSKNIDFGLGSGPGMAFDAKGGSGMAIAAYLLAPRNLGIAVPKSSTLTLAEFKGKKLAVSTPGSLTYWLVQRLSEKMGWGQNGIVPVPLDAPPARFAALRSNQVDGVVNATELTFALEDRDQIKEIYNFSTLVPKFITDVVFTRKDLIKDKPDMVRRFVAAWLESTEYMHNHKDKTVEIAAKVLGSPPPLVARIYDWEMPEFSHTDRFDPEAVAILKDSFIATGELKTKPADSELFTEAFLPKEKAPGN